WWHDPDNDCEPTLCDLNSTNFSLILRGDSLTLPAVPPSDCEYLIRYKINQSIRERSGDIIRFKGNDYLRLNVDVPHFDSLRVYVYRSRYDFNHEDAFGYMDIFIKK